MNSRGLMISNLPKSSGVYLMFDEHNHVIYVGKAKSIRNRVKNYFSHDGDSRFLIPFLVSSIQRIETITTNSEKEALLLENTLIKKYRPKYNILLKDDKTYLYAKVNVDKEFPDLELVRKRQNDHALYFGPYTSSSALKDSLSAIRKIFKLRPCRDVELNSAKRPCIKHPIGLCHAPCVGLISKEEYSTLIENTIQLLKGHTHSLIQNLKAQMAEHSNNMEFEKAASIRDQIKAIRLTTENQIVISNRYRDMDVISVYHENSTYCVTILFIRGGALTGSKSFMTETLLAFDLSSFVLQYYLDPPSIPELIIIPKSFAEQAMVKEILAEKFQQPIEFKVADKGNYLKLMELSKKNAKDYLYYKQSDSAQTEKNLEAIKYVFHLSKLPYRIECVDISNIQSSHPVASCVAFIDGKPNKSHYRHYQIKATHGQNDFGMIYEVVSRRLKTGMDQNSLPDLMMIDGGKGQLNAACEAAKNVNLSIDMVSIAKEKTKTTGEKTVDRFYIPGRSNPIILKMGSPALKLLVTIRDEAHRFAITYHRLKRGKSALVSELDQIPGLGLKRKKQLLTHFGSVNAIRKASLNEIEALPGISKKLALSIHTVIT